MYLQGEREHCFSKSRFQRTNKQRSSFVGGIAREEAIERSITEIEKELTQLQEKELLKNSEPGSSCEVDGSALQGHYVMADQSRSPIILQRWLRENASDPALTVGCQ